MRLREFQEQDSYCRENNTPEGVGCDNCPANDKEHCADALRNLCGKFLEAVKTRISTEEVSEELNSVYDISPFSQLAIIQGVIEFSK